MFNKYIENSKETTLYYHKTDGGAEYLTDAFMECPNGHKEGIFDGANLVIRIDGGVIDIMKKSECINTFSDEELIPFS
jgi:hypothetical protein